VLSVTLDQFVDLGRALHCGAKQIFRESANVITDSFPFTPKGSLHVIRALPPHVSLEQHLQCQFA
jgi:hypothetical protein